jgi:UDP-glucose 4-epimerase
VRILVTGGAGFIGSALTRRLSAGGHDAIVLDDMSRGSPARLHGTRCEIAYGDVRDRGAVTRAMHGCDAAAHLASLQGTALFYADPRTVLDVALRGILNVLDACERTGCGRLLLVSSSEAYQEAAVIPTPEDVPLTVPDPRNPRYSYGGGKIASELAALAWARAGILNQLAVARPHNVYGPDMGREHVIPEFCLRMNELTAAQPDGVIPFRIQGAGTETRSFCWIGDAVSQLVLLLKTPPGTRLICNVGSMDEHSAADVAYAVAGCYGRDIKIEPGILTPGSPLRRLPDTAVIDALGAPPRTPFADGLAATVSWYREHG